MNSSERKELDAQKAAIARMRRVMGLTQEELAAELEVSRSYLNQLEGGRRKASAKIMKAIRRFEEGPAFPSPSSPPLEDAAERTERDIEDATVRAWFRYILENAPDGERLLIILQVRAIFRHVAARAEDAARKSKPD